MKKLRIQKIVIFIKQKPLIEEQKAQVKPTKRDFVFLPNFLTIIDVESYKKFNEKRNNISQGNDEIFRIF